MAFGFESRGGGFPMKGQLNVKKLESFKEPGRYHDGYGLYLQVASDRLTLWAY
jgi:hypothetical protein